jgi:hypothetical protein
VRASITSTAAAVLRGTRSAARSKRFTNREPIRGRSRRRLPTLACVMSDVDEGRRKNIEFRLRRHAVVCICDSDTTPASRPSLWGCVAAGSGDERKAGGVGRGGRGTRPAHRCTG